MPRIYTEVEVEVGLEEFDNDDLIEELMSRKFTFVQNQEIIERLYIAYSQHNQQMVDELIRALLYEALGKII